MEFIRYILGDFWHFAGFVFILWIVLVGIADIVNSIKKVRIMKSKQYLDVQQMQHLQELGLELKETTMYWARCVDNNPRAATHYGKWVLIKGNNAQTVGLMHWEFIPAYTLQGVLDVLPKEIKPNNTRYFLRIDLADKCVYYYCDDYNFVERRKKVIGYDDMDGLIDAAYEMLVWCIENKFVETNKNE